MVIAVSLLAGPELLLQPPHSHWSIGHLARAWASGLQLTEPAEPAEPNAARSVPGSRPTGHGAAAHSSPFQIGSPAGLVLLRPLPPPRALETDNCKAPRCGEWESGVNPEAVAAVTFLEDFLW